jgi:hypothetical protein
MSVPGLLARIVEVGCLQALVEQVQIIFIVNTHHLTHKMTSTPGSAGWRIQKIKGDLSRDLFCFKDGVY